MCQTSSRSRELVERGEGKATLRNGADSDRFKNKFDSNDLNTSIELASPRVGYVSNNAARKEEVAIEYMSENLPTRNQTPQTGPDSSDTRSLRKDLNALVDQVVALNEVQKEDLYAVLIKYLSHMTTKPGKCTLFSYKFQVDSDKPIEGYSRPIPFATRPAVREQIDQMLRDDILEISTSPVVNPLTVVSRKGKISICVYAHKVNQVTLPDRERSSPINELLQ
jgi:hypothetical protein